MPDVPVDEIDELRASADARDIDTVLLAAPGSTPERLSRIASIGARVRLLRCNLRRDRCARRLSSTARGLVAALRPMTDLPLLVGVGIATPEHAAQAVRFADGVAVGSALMARLLEADRDGALALAAEFRRAMD